MIARCTICEKEVNRNPSYITNHPKIYCSKECRKIGSTTRELHTCTNCGKEIYRTSSELKKSKSGNVFCSKSCAASVNNSVSKSGVNNPNWISGISSYTKDAFSTYVNECAICRFSEKAALQVHHIDVDRLNNNIDNLIILCANHHCMVHYGSLVISEEIKSSREMLGSNPIT